jgi:hypothetical protein
MAVNLVSETKVVVDGKDRAPSRTADQTMRWIGNMTE